MTKAYVSTETEMWIAEDGTYGSDRIVIVDFSNWTDDDFEQLDNAPKFEKQATALEINLKRNPQSK